MPWTGKELPHEKEDVRSRILRDGRAVRHDMMLLLKLLSDRFILFSLFNLDKVLQSVKIKEGKS